MTGNRGGRAASAAAVLALAVCGCTAATGEAGPKPTAAGTGQAGLAGVCPDPVVVQTNWWPQAEYGAVYRLLGPDPTVDRDGKRVTGRLVASGRDTGVRVQVRSGGPANGFVPAAKMLYADRQITLGGVDLDQVIQVTGSGQRVLAVFAPLDLSPLVILWDRRTHPGFTTIGDIGQTDMRVLYFPGATYMEFLVGSGILRRSQVEGSYDGSPARFVADDGRVAQQGYLTNEVYAYQHEVKQWARPVAYQLVSDAGYPTYPETLAIRADRREELTGCLRRLVPILQQATVDYLADPQPTNELIVRLAKDFGGYPYSMQRAAYAVRVMAAEGIMGNGADRTVGDFDPARVDKLLSIVRPIFAGQKQPVPDGLAPGELFTNQFVNPAIGLPARPPGS